MNQPTKLRLKLAGTNGNGFALLGAAVRVARKAGWTPEQVDEFKAKATKADHDHLLRILEQHFEVE